MTDAPTEREGEGTFSKLRRRKVVQWSLAYAAAAWTLLQVIEYLGETYSWPPAIRQIVTPALALGSLLVLVLAWYHGDKGDQRVSRPEFAILATIVAFVGGTLWWYVSRMDESTWIAETNRPAIKYATPTDTRPSIAVLPFENRSAKQDDAFFVDGVHDDILTQLTKIGAMKVIARTSVEQFRDTKLTTKEIGKKLGVTRVLEGGVQRAGDRVRVTVQLIDATTDAHLWAESYDRELTAANIFAIQSEVAAAVSGALKTTLTSAEAARVNAIPTQSLVAWESYQLGKQRMAKRTSAALAEAEAFFRRSIELDPRFALAYVGLADTLTLQVTYAGAPRDTTYAKADEAAGRALEIDPNLGEAWASSAYIATERGEFDQAEPMFRRAIELNPNYATAYLWFSAMFDYSDRRNDALVYAQRSAELDPLSAIINLVLGKQLGKVGRFDEAEARFRRAIEIDPSMPNLYMFSGLLKAYVQDRIADGIPFLEKAAELDPGAPLYQFWLALLYLDIGDDVQARRVIESARQHWPSRPGLLGVTAALDLDQGDMAAVHEGAERLLALDARASYPLQLLRNADLQAGRPAVARARYASAYPELLGAEPPRTADFNWVVAIDLVPVLQRTGESERAGMLLDRSEDAIKAIPRLGILTFEGYGIADVQIHALRGEKAKALAALREAEKAGWRGRYWRYFRDLDPALASIRNEPEFKAVFTDIERDMARQRAELAKRPKDAPLDVGAASR